MTSTVAELEGDIYRWRWTDDELAKFQGHDPYWCKSCIAIVKNGRLIDTYWSDFSSEYAIDPSRVDLNFMGKLSWPTVNESEALRYDRDDLCDMRHANSSRALIYVRPGAQLNRAAILEEIGRREEEAQSAIRGAQWRLQDLAKSRAAAEAGRLDEVRL